MILTNQKTAVLVCSFRLRDCDIRAGGVALTLGPASLRELDLSRNLCADSTLLQLSKALQEPQYKLQILR